MATEELRVINAVLKNRDIGTLFNSGSADDLFIGYPDVWKFVKGHYSRYHTVPSIETVHSEFPSFEEVDISEQTKYYLDRLSTEVIGNRLQSLIYTAADKLKTQSPQEVKNRFINELMKLNRFDNSARDLNIMDFEKAEEHYEAVRQRSALNGGTPGIPTGISFIDSAYPSGLCGGDLIIVLGWTGRGKSLFTSLVAVNAHAHGKHPMIMSLEMSAEKIRDRVYTIQGSGLFSNSGLMLGDYDRDNFRNFAKKHADDREFTVIRHDGIGELTPNLCQSKIDQYNPDLFILDYAQLAMDNNLSSDMTTRMRNISKESKMMAVMNDIPVILISSATPEGSASMKEPPIIEQVAWSKQLSYDADLGMAVHRQDGSNIIELVGRKNRNGDLFAAALDWDIDSGKYEEKFDW